MNSTWSWENIPKYFHYSIKICSNALEHNIITPNHAKHFVLHLYALLFICFPAFASFR